MGHHMLYSCCWTYSVVALLFIKTQAEEFHPQINHHHQGFYTLHTVFTNPLLYSHQTAQLPPSAPGHYHRGIFPPSGPQVRPHFFNQHHQNQQFFNGVLGGEDNRRIPFDGPLFSPADGLETAETPGQLENYNKALQEILLEQFGPTGGGNESNGGFNHGGGDQLNFNLELLGRTSFVRVRQSFGNKRSNYNYQYAV